MECQSYKGVVNCDYTECVSNVNGFCYKDEINELKEHMEGEQNEKNYSV